MGIGRICIHCNLDTFDGPPILHVHRMGLSMLFLSSLGFIMFLNAVILLVMSTFSFLIFLAQALKLLHLLLSLSC